MSGAEVGLILGLISSTIDIIQASKAIYDAANNSESLPEAFREVAERLPLVSTLLKDAEQYVKNPGTDPKTRQALRDTLEPCKTRAKKLQDLFAKVISKEGASVWDRYRKAVRTLGKGELVETLFEGILTDLNVLSVYSVFPTARKQDLAMAIEELEAIQPSLAENLDPTYTHYGSGSQNNYTGSGAQNNNTGSGQQYIGQTQHFDQREYNENFVSYHRNSIDNRMRVLNISNHVSNLQSPEDQLLGSLHSRLRRTKHDEIKDPDPNTCEWIWCDDRNGGTTLLDWLRTSAEEQVVQDPLDQLIFWISGKPGAGKSTLMKYICNNLPEKMGPSWNSDKQILHFFFSNNRDKESEIVDFLNSILHQLCSKNQNLIPIIFNDYIDRREYTSAEYIWDRKSLRKTLTKLSKQDILSGTAILFVDGLDECADEQSELIECLESLVQDFSSQKLKLKICAASRPENVISQMLHRNPGFKYQEKNKSDIEKFAYHQLSKATRMARWEDEDFNYEGGPYSLSDLIEQFVRKSEGVFIWARLMIKELCKLIRTGGDMWQCVMQLRETPSDLSSAYAMIFQKIKETRNGSLDDTMIYLYMISSWSFLNDNPTLLDFSLMRDGWDKVAGRYYGEISLKEKIQRFRRAQAHVLACCDSLVEMAHSNNETDYDYSAEPAPSSDPINQYFPHHHVKFVHLTVEEHLKFLRKEETAEEEAEIEITISKSSMTILLGLCMTNNLHDGQIQFNHFIDQFFFHARVFEYFSNTAATEFITAMEFFLTSYPDKLTDYWKRKGYQISMDAPYFLRPNHSFTTTLAIHHGLDKYLDHSWNLNPNSRDHTIPYLLSNISHADFIPVAKVLLKHGWRVDYRTSTASSFSRRYAAPSYKLPLFEIMAPWDYPTSTASSFSRSDAAPSYKLPLFEMMTPWDFVIDRGGCCASWEHYRAYILLFLDYGADPNWVFGYAFSAHSNIYTRFPKHPLAEFLQAAQSISKTWQRGVRNVIRKFLVKGANPYAVIYRDITVLDIAATYDFKAREFILDFLSGENGAEEDDDDSSLEKTLVPKPNTDSPKPYTYTGNPVYDWTLGCSPRTEGYGKPVWPAIAPGGLRAGYPAP